MTTNNPDNKIFEDRNLWESNVIQFPRLLAEIVATQDTLDINALCDAMDLEPEDIDVLFDRAQSEWENIKDLYI